MKDYETAKLLFFAIVIFGTFSIFDTLQMASINARVEKLEAELFEASHEAGGETDE